MKRFAIFALCLAIFVFCIGLIGGCACKDKPAFVPTGDCEMRLMALEANQTVITSHLGKLSDDVCNKHDARLKRLEESKAPK